MNLVSVDKSDKRWSDVKLSYLTSKVPPDRYNLFLRGNLLVFIGYLIATMETLIAIYAGLTDITYSQTFYISSSILMLTSILLSFTYFKKNLLVWQEWFIFAIYLITFLFAISIWIYWLGDLRLLGILNALTAVTIVLSYTNVIQSLLMSISTLVCYYAVTWYSIRIAGQAGSLAKETFLSFCLLPAFLLISSAAYYMKKRRKDLQRVKHKLEKLNDELSVANARLKKEQKLTEIEMDLAREIQNAVFPKKAIETHDWDIAFVTKSFGAVSGDFFDFYSMYNSLKGISLFDVSGHGVAPALITILAKPVLYSHFNHYASSKLGVVLESTNSDLQDELEEVNLYITGLLLRMNGSEVEYVNAGHPDLIHVKSKADKVQAVTGSSDSFKGHPIGITGGKQEYESLKFTVESGDFLILYSDGLTEGRNLSGEQFGLTRLSNAIASSEKRGADDVLRHVMESFNEFTGHTKAGDDITLIVAGKI